ncbi:MAG TPA: hypothetical protein VMI31_08530 [Fimbriimonadaceae bacterium]|nr:hypothetical protein [Fimbriimonadaceae bacterium]
MKRFFLLLIVLASSFAGAADSFDEHCANIAILQDRNVQNEIGVSAAQRNRMNQFADANRNELLAYKKKLGGKPPDPAVLDRYMLELKGNVDNVLTAGQLKRLREVSLQWAGLLGLMDKTVASRVGLEGSQYAKFKQTFIDGQAAVAKINQQVNEELRPIGEKYQRLALAYKGHEQEHQAEIKQLFDQFQKEAAPIKAKYAPRVQEITKETKQKMLAILTPKEVSAWTQLKGRTYVPPKGKS